MAKEMESDYKIVLEYGLKAGVYSLEITKGRELKLLVGASRSAPYVDLKNG